MKVSYQPLLLSGLLCAGGFFAGYQYGGRTVSAPNPSTISVVPLRSAEADPSSDKKEENAAQPFQWSQLESTDYRTYIANLRRIGCPEQTIRDIITADVDSVFAGRRDRFAASASGTAVQDSLANLRREEDQFLISLLGPPPGKDTEIAARPEPARLLRAKSPDSIPALPLVLQSVDLASLKLSSAQMEVIDNLRQKFRQEIGTGADTNDPAYRELWLKAQHESDSLLRGMLGMDAYLNYQRMAANQQSQAATQ